MTKKVAKNMFMFPISFRVDSFMLTSLHRRPRPRGASGIGRWFELIKFIGWAAIVSNMGLILFETKHQFWIPNGIDWPEDLILFILFEVC